MEWTHTTSCTFAASSNSQEEELDIEELRRVTSPFLKNDNHIHKDNVKTTLTDISTRQLSSESIFSEVSTDEGNDPNIAEEAQNSSPLASLPIEGFHDLNANYYNRLSQNNIFTQSSQIILSPPEHFLQTQKPRGHFVSEDVTLLPKLEKNCKLNNLKHLGILAECEPINTSPVNFDKDIHLFISSQLLPITSVSTAESQNYNTNEQIQEKSVHGNDYENEAINYDILVPNSIEKITPNLVGWNFNDNNIETLITPKAFDVIIAHNKLYPLEIASQVLNEHMENCLSNDGEDGMSNIEHVLSQISVIQDDSVYDEIDDNYSPAKIHQTSQSNSSNDNKYENIYAVMSEEELAKPIKLIKEMKSIAVQTEITSASYSDSKFVVKKRRSLEALCLESPKRFEVRQQILDVPVTTNMTKYNTSHHKGKSYSNKKSKKPDSNSEIIHNHADKLTTVEGKSKMLVNKSIEKPRVRVGLSRRVNLSKSLHQKY